MATKTKKKTTFTGFDMKGRVDGAKATLDLKILNADESAERVASALAKKLPKRAAKLHVERKGKNLVVHADLNGKGFVKYESQVREAFEEVVSAEVAQGVKSRDEETQAEPFPGNVRETIFRDLASSLSVEDLNALIAKLESERASRAPAAEDFKPL